PAVTEYLDFQMTGRLDQLLEEDRVIAEGRTGLGAGTGERAWQVFRPVDPAHAATTAAGAGLDHDRIADASGGGDQFLGGGAGAVKAGNNRHAGRLGDAPRLDFRPHRLHGFSRRADEDQPGFGAGADESRILRQEAVAGMNGIGPAGAGSGDDRRDVEIAFRRRRRSQPPGDVGQAHMQGTRIGIGVDGYRAQAEAAAGGDDAAGDLAPVGD